MNTPQWIVGSKPPVARGSIMTCLVTVEISENYVTMAERESGSPGEVRTERIVMEAFYSSGENDLGEKRESGWYVNGYHNADLKVIAWMKKPAPYSGKAQQ